MIARIAKNPYFLFTSTPNDFGVNCSENIDEQTLKFIEEFEMSTLIEVNEKFGSFSENDRGFAATFTDLGSSAINTLSVVDDTLTIQFQNNSEVYEYNTSTSATETIREEVTNILQNGKGSIGAVFNELLRQNKIQLI